jgi:hypothetical protein
MFDFIPEKFRKLVLNVGLAFVAAFAATFGTLLAATPKAPDKSALLALVAAAVWAGFRAAIGALGLSVNAVPTIPTDE